MDLDGDGQIDTRTRFAYDGNQIVWQFDRALAPTGDPADPLALEDLSHRYLWNPAAVDQLMADEQVPDPAVAGDIVWPLADHLGTIRDLAAYDSATDTTTVVNHRTFDAYGRLQSQTNAAVDCLFAYTGRPLDQETGLQNNLHRWYDLATGRWMSEDTIGFEGRDGNLFGYVANGPVNGVDPSGLGGKRQEITDAPIDIVVRPRVTPDDRWENEYRVVDIVFPDGVFQISIEVQYRPEVAQGIGTHAQTTLIVRADFLEKPQYTGKTLKLAVVERVNSTGHAEVVAQRENLVTKEGWFVSSSQYLILPTTIPRRSASIFPGDYFPPYNAPSEWKRTALGDFPYAGHSGQTSASAWFRHHAERKKQTALIAPWSGRKPITSDYILGIKCEETDEWIGFVRFGVQEVFTKHSMEGHLLIYHAKAPASESPFNYGDVWHGGSFWGATLMPQQFREAIDRFNARFKTQW